MQTHMAGTAQGQDARRGRPDRHLLVGLVLMVFGALMMVVRLTSVDFEAGWPFLLILFGIWKLIDPPPSGRVRRSRRVGVWLLFIGCWGLVNSAHLFGMDYDISWPLLVIGAGGILVWRSLEGPDMPRRQER